VPISALRRGRNLITFSSILKKTGFGPEWAGLIVMKQRSQARVIPVPTGYVSCSN
jgi:hypothetical protein